ncbi:tail fiber domain-containing protein [Ancylobacter mangrovi]|uniref:tail fiber domain-containing protein n=1 Tax=Ancylobacter mangrovi TaxID=2972472 RepID=UPI002162467C|nr:tail fiber domain-containing protein [Ancylobacter mangrovi]MCS0501371.1 tail fiber domain-containing protein [Ancylobacter mangrovi]
MNSFYATGTLSVAAGGTVVTGAGTLWTMVLQPGDTLFADGLLVPITTVDSNTQLTLGFAWPGDALEDAAYVARYDSPVRYSNAYLAQRAQELVRAAALLEGTAPYYVARAVGQNAPPGAPVLDDIYVVGGAPTGAFAGHANQLAQWTGTDWAFTVPASGWHVASEANGLTYAWLGGAWGLTAGVSSVVGQVGAVTATQIGAALQAGGGLVRTLAGRTGDVTAADMASDLLGAIGYAPVQEGTGVSQATGYAIKIGAEPAANAVRLTVNSTDFGRFKYADGKVAGTGFRDETFGGVLRINMTNTLSLHWNSGFYYNVDGNSWVLINSSPSDERLKQDIAPLGDALTSILALQPKTFSFREGLPIAHTAGTHPGLIAQNVQTVLPRAIEEAGMPPTIGENGPEVPAYTGTYLRFSADADKQLITLLIGAVQELAARVSALEPD